MTSTEQHLRAVASFGNAHAKFILEHGCAFEPDERTFKGRRMTIKECFSNAAKMVWRDPSLTYVEGYADAIIPVHHAWVMRADGSIIDPTLRLKGRVGPDPHAYFGVPFKIDFVLSFVCQTKTYGLLDGMSKQSIDLMTGKIEPTEFLAKIKEAA